MSFKYLQELTQLDAPASDEALPAPAPSRPTLSPSDKNRLEHRLSILVEHAHRGEQAVTSQALMDLGTRAGGDMSYLETAKSAAEAFLAAVEEMHQYWTMSSQDEQLDTPMTDGDIDPDSEEDDLEATNKAAR
jgi:hypothetical protein